VYAVFCVGYEGINVVVVTIPDPSPFGVLCVVVPLAEPTYSLSLYTCFLFIDSICLNPKQVLFIVSFPLVQFIYVRTFSLRGD
jgi:hypothetical protein